jgi:CRP/FNR family transcriptional regulator, cyclic AMP receptor protein
MRNLGSSLVPRLRWRSSHDTLPTDRPSRPAAGHQGPSETMRSLWLLSECTDGEIRFVDSICTQVNVDAGQTLIRQHAHGREFFISRQGTAAVTIDDQLAGLIEPGYFFGELALLCECPRTATVTAATPMELLALSQREFASLLAARVPSITNKMMTVLAKRSRPHRTSERTQPGRDERRPRDRNQALTV